ncbi:MAG: hypothetical protein WAS51_01985 [Ilumatobacteraceae bacterium]
MAVPPRFSSIGAVVSGALSGALATVLSAEVSLGAAVVASALVEAVLALFGSLFELHAAAPTASVASVTTLTIRFQRFM